MIILFIISFLTSGILALTFPESNLKCPTITSLSGHNSPINGILHIPGTLYYISLEIENKFMISDVRTGEVYQKANFMASILGATALASQSNTDTLILSKNNVYIYNVLQLKQQILLTFDPSKPFNLSYAEVVTVFDLGTGKLLETFVVIQSDNVVNCTVFLPMTSDYKGSFSI